MDRLVVSALSMICFVLLTTGWVYISSNMVIIYRRIFRRSNYLQNKVFITIFYGFILEILMSLISLFLSHFFKDGQSADSPFMLGLKNGLYYTVFLSPLSSITGAARGIKTRIFK